MARTSRRWSKDATNADIIFGIEKDTEESAESYAIKVQSLPSALILNAIMRLEENKHRKKITAEFLRSTVAYDGSAEEFASCLKRIDIRAVGITPPGRLMKKTENLAWRVAHNTARLDHPLVAAKSNSLSLHRAEIPPSNAAYVTVIENTNNFEIKASPSIQQNPKNKVEEVLESYRKRMKMVESKC